MRVRQPRVVQDGKVSGQPIRVDWRATRFRFLSRAGALAAALLALPLLSSGAAAQLAISSNDGKAVLVNGVNTVPPNPADHTVTLIVLFEIGND